MSILDSTQANPAPSGAPALQTTDRWEAILEGEARQSLEAVLPHFMLPRRWFGSKARTLRGVTIFETVPVLPTAHLLMLRVEYTEGEGETYVLPVAFAASDEAHNLIAQHPTAVIARLRTGDASGVLYDAVWDPRFCQALLTSITEGRQYRGGTGDVVALRAAVLSRLAGDATSLLPPVLLGVEQSNTSIRFDKRLILKLYRKLEAGVNPDQEIGQFLTDVAAFPNTPPLAGVIEFRRHEPMAAEPVTLALLQGYVHNQGDAWKYTLDTLADYYTRLRGSAALAPANLVPDLPLLELVRSEIPADATEAIGAYLASARQLGQRTAELHLALALNSSDPGFAPQPFTSEFQAYLHESMHGLTVRIMQLLRSRLDALSSADAAEARRVLELENTIMARFDSLITQPIHAMLTRIHGDYHLGQVLYTGNDFMIIDFEGEPARPLSERRMKRSPLQDVAGMLRSLHYAAYAAYFTEVESRPEAVELEPWARFWHLWVSVAYLQAYLKVAGGAPFLPTSPAELALLLNVHLLEKAVYELGYELNNRPAWARIPLQGILATVGRER